MQGTWLEQMRFGLESIEVLQNAIVAEMLAIQDNPKDKAYAENKVFNFLTMIQDKAKGSSSFYKEEGGLKKEELAIIEGQKSLKGGDNKKSNDVIWQNFYEKARQIKQTYKSKEMLSQSLPRNTVEYFRGSLFKPPFKEPEFSLQQNKGKYVDMHKNYMQYLNVCKMFENQQTKLHDYLWFLQNFDKFDSFAINKKFKFQVKYINYMKSLTDYLVSFLRRSRPLLNLEQFLNSFHQKFEEKYEEGKLLGWQSKNEHFNEQSTQYCPHCKKLFLTNDAYVGHLMGKKHIRLAKEEIEGNIEQQQQRTRQQFKEQNEKRKKGLAFMEYNILRIKDELATVIYDTMNLVRKKQTRGYEEIDENVQSESESQEGDEPIYNPKNLPLGWDGKPIPYWLYKLHGLGIQYKCQICGNYSYWGRRAFEMHFQEWRHTYGMKCLKIPNTIHFKDITTINDALALHEKLMRQSQEGQFRPDIEEEFEDNQGNLLNKKTYLDMKKQGLIG